MSAPVGIDSFSVAHLPIVKEYARRMGLVEVIDEALSCAMHARPGKIVLGLIMNVLCGRSPDHGAFPPAPIRSIWDKEKLSLFDLSNHVDSSFDKEVSNFNNEEVIQTAFNIDDDVCPSEHIADNQYEAIRISQVIIGQILQ
jgi:hypothetical protein